MSARASHSSAVAEAKIRQQEEEIRKARLTASGFQNTVDKMNREFVKRLDSLKFMERQKRGIEDLEAAKERNQNKKEEEMKRKLQAKYQKIDMLKRNLKDRLAATGRGNLKVLFMSDLSNAASKR